MTDLIADTPPTNLVTDGAVSNRFWMHVDKSGDCWLWMASRNNDGYGEAWAGGRVRKAHRVAWEGVRGPVPDGLEIDHLCRTRACVNPDHLEAVTHRENVARGASPSALGAQQTSCVHGHPFDDANTRRTDRQRVCRECERLKGVARKAANPERFLALARARTADWKRRKKEMVNA